MGSGSKLELMDAFSGFTLLEALAVDAKQYTLKGEHVKKCIRMGIAVLKLSFVEANRQFILAN